MYDDRDFSESNPANLLPFERELEPQTESVEKLPFQFQGSGSDLFTDPLAY